VEGIRPPCAGQYTCTHLGRRQLVSLPEQNATLFKALVRYALATRFKALWRWCITIAITILGIIHRPVSYSKLNSDLALPQTKHMTSPLRAQEKADICREGGTPKPLASGRLNREPNDHMVQRPYCVVFPNLSTEAERRIYFRFAYGQGESYLIQGHGVA
jgi:hypothetical protein